MTTYDGELDSFEIEPQTGDVLAWIGDSEGYAHRVRLTHAEVAGIAEASAEAFRMRTVTCTRCHLGRPAFEMAADIAGICITCIMSR